MSDRPIDETINVTIQDDDKDELAVNPNGSINVVPAPPSAPSGTTEVIEEVFSTVSSTAGVDTMYTITNAKTLTIQLMQISAEDETGGSVVELFEDPNGDLSVLNRIGTLIANGASNEKTIDADYVGDGTRRIIMRRRGYTSSGREIEGRWIGFEQ